MGVGDWIMATGQIKTMYAAKPVPVLVVDGNQRPQWSEVFTHNPKIIPRRMRMNYQTLLNAGGHRPYIAGRSPDRWMWRKFGPIPGEFFFSQVETIFASRYTGLIMIEPNVKARNTHKNKEWPFERWQQLVNRLPHGVVMQCGPIGTRWLDKVHRVVTPTFRHAAVALSVAKVFVGSEGGLMHAAAAVNVPAIILWSEFIDPSITGYTNHINIRYAERTCGMRTFCPTCLQSMLAITVDEVEEKIRSVL